MPFRLHGVSFSLAAAMSSILGDCKEFCGIYYDDSIIFSCDIESHLEHLKTVFENFAEFGLLVNLGKCQFIQESVTFLGHILSGEGIRPDIGKVQEILRFSVPKTCSEVKPFLGMASFFRKFVLHFSQCAAPLFELLKKSRLFEWTDECERGFNFIKSKLQDPRILVHPQFDRPFIIHCDASGKAIGFMLAQMYDNMLKPIMFGGRVLSEVEQRYATVDKELLACYFAIKKCEIYVLGYDFIVYTDISL